MITAHRHKTTSLFVYRMSVTCLQMASAVTASATIPVHLWQSSSVSLSGSPSDLRWGTRTVSCATQYSHKHVKQILDRDSHKAVLNNIILLLLMAGMCPTVKGKSSLYSITCPTVKGKSSLYSITERRVLELILVLVSQPAGDVSHKLGGRLPLLSVRPAVTPATLKRAATNFAAWWTQAQWVWTVCLRHPKAPRLRFEPGPLCARVQHANHSASEPPYPTVAGKVCTEFQ